MTQTIEYGIRLKGEDAGVSSAAAKADASLKKLEQTSESSGNAAIRMKAKEDALIASLREKVIRLEKGEAGLLRYQAAQIGAAKSAEPLIAKIDELNRKNGEGADGAARLSSAIAKVGHYGSALAGIGLTKELIVNMFETADEMQRLDARLRLVTESAEGFNQVQSELVAISQANGSALQETTQFYIKLAQTGADYNITQSQTLRLTDLMGKSLRISGANAAESASSMLQFSQALGSGKLGGDEFRAMMESNLTLMKALANGLDVPLGKLKQMAAEGELTTERIVAALIKSGNSIDEQAAKLDGGITPAMQRLRNETSLLVKELDNAFSSSKIVAGGMDVISLAAEKLRKKLTIPGGWASIMPGPLGGAASVFTEASILVKPGDSNGRSQSGKISTVDSQHAADMKRIDDDLDAFRKGNKLKDKQALEEIYLARVAKLVEFVRFGKMSQDEFLRWESQFRQNMLGKSSGEKSKPIDKQSLWADDMQLAAKQMDADQKMISAALKDVEEAIKAQDQAWRDHYSLIATADADELEQIEVISAAEEARKESLQKEAQALLEVLDPTIKLNEQQDRYFQMLSEGMIDQDQYNEAIKRMGEATSKNSSLAKDLGITMSSAAENAIEHWQGFGNLLQKIGIDIEKLIFRRTVTEPLMKGMDGLVSSAMGSLNVGDWFSGIFGGGRASGGSVQPGKMYEVNENSPELLTTGGRTFLMMGGERGWVTPPSTSGGASAGSPSVGIQVNIIGAPSQPQVNRSVDDNGNVSIDVMFERVEGWLGKRMAKGEGLAEVMQGRYGLNAGYGARG